MSPNIRKQSKAHFVKVPNGPLRW